MVAKVGEVKMDMGRLDVMTAPAQPHKLYSFN
jgi:hypothetical protein